MSFALGLAQAGYPHYMTPLEQAELFAQRAHEHGVTLLVFPENLMCPRELTTTELLQLAEPLDGEFAQGLCGIARTNALWIVFTMFQTNPAGGPPHNTAVVVDSAGHIRGSYCKCHLYNAHGVCESDRMGYGNELCHAIRTPFCTIGLGICYDLRFPEVARTLALQGCDLLIFPAAWHDGPNKPEHWETLLRARAIENECFVAGVCHAGERYVGISHVFDPLGNPLVQRSATSDLSVCDIDLQAADAARDAMPIFAHRRPHLYGALASRAPNVLRDGLQYE
ncbi:MAG: nitrilase-related carbon-nitrogen hydrolase [Coriobacteriales bacterium]|nr:nitrilase-related carbon-nitrogen hydrolase [Coriobacteriales bacterium]